MRQPCEEAVADALVSVYHVWMTTPEPSLERMAEASGVPMGALHKAIRRRCDASEEWVTQIETRKLKCANCGTVPCPLLNLQESLR